MPWTNANGVGLQVPNLRRLAELVQVRDEGTPPASENGVTTEASI